MIKEKIKLTTDSLKAVVENLLKVPPRTFSKTSAARKIWLVTEEDRRVHEELKLSRVLNNYERLKSALQGKYALLTQTARRVTADEGE